MALFRKKKAKNIDEKQIIVPQQTENVMEQENGVKTVLHIHEDWDLNPQERYVYQFHHHQLPKLKENQISIFGLKFIEYNGDLVVVSFLRNTLPKPIRFEKVDLVVFDEKGEVVGKKQFELDTLGELPALSCTPWRFLFSEDEWKNSLEPNDSWKMAFELKSSNENQKLTLDLEKSWESHLSPDQRKKLENIILSLPSLQPDEINLTGLEAVYNENQSLSITVLIRNGSSKNIKLEQVPLIVEDAEGEIVCNGSFKLGDFEVKAKTCKPWTFIFPSELVLKANPNLKSWKVYPPSETNTK